MSGINAGVIISILSFLGALIVWLVKLGRWQGRLEGKLDSIVEIKEDVEELHEIINDHENRLTTLEVTCNLRHGVS